VPSSAAAHIPPGPRWSAGRLLELGVQQLPTLADEPRLGKPASREWAVLTRLLDGQRVSAIAADLYVSQSTVRNHLSSIYAKLGVHTGRSAPQRTGRRHQ
jgi:DNA-binding NarL/FixJ family response regulator